jgi:hypothetical protein
MGFMASVRKGFGFFLNSMGVSTYAKKPKPAAVAGEPVVPVALPTKLD